MPFHDRNFASRFGTMGDIAEQIYEQVRPFGETVRFGWRRPRGVSVKLMPQVIRHMPDYYTNSGYLVEVMGLGRDSILKSIKPDKWDALKEWQRLCRAGGTSIMFFVWNSHTEEYVVLSYDVLKELVAKSRRKGAKTFNDGKEYYPISWEDIKTNVEWIGKWHAED